MDADGNNFEFKCSTHGNPLSKSGASYERTVENLGGDPNDPWKVFDETRALYDKRRAELVEIAKERKAAYCRWASENPEKAAELQSWIDGKIPAIDYKSIQHKPNVATRTASADVLTLFGEQIKNMIVSSADLSNSDKTESFVKKCGTFMSPENLSGAFYKPALQN